MEKLINEEAERIKGSPHNLEMPSCSNPPELPWKPTSWIHGEPIANVQESVTESHSSKDSVDRGDRELIAMTFVETN